MPSMLSYPRRLPSGHFTCYLHRTYHVLTTHGRFQLTMPNTSCTIITPASLRSDCCSPSLRNAVRVPSGIDVSPSPEYPLRSGQALAQRTRKDGTPAKKPCFKEYWKLCTFDQFSALAATYHFCQPVFPSLGGSHGKPRRFDAKVT